MKKIFLILLAFYSITFLRSQTTIMDTFMFDGLQRDYLLYIPQVYNGSVAVPLVLNLHGRGSNAGEQNLYGNFHPQADADNFLIVIPNSTIIGGTKLWNSSIIPTGTAGYVDDVSYLSALIDTMIARYNIDTSQIFSTGMSNGGFMSYTLACELGNRIKKIASVTGSMTSSLYSSCSPNGNIPVLQIHGTTDPVVPYNGGSGMQAIEDVVDFWVSNNNCNTTPNSYNLPDINTNDNSTAIRYTYSYATDSNNVVFYKILDGGHTWPDAIIDLPSGNTNRDFNASQVIWNFFKGENLETGLNTVLENDIVFKRKNNIMEVISDLNKIEKLEIYDVLGKKVVVSYNNLINFDTIQKGLYFIIVYTNNGSISKSFTKQ